MERRRKLYPIGIQTFSNIRGGDYLYIDKTEYVYRMASSDAKYVFLSRPRRFGKSLLASTLESYFSGRKDLFRGLAIEKLEKEWIKYPVLHFDMSTAKYAEKADLESELNLKLVQYEQIYGKGDSEANFNQRLQGLIKRACEQTGRQVVVLIDEYDAPLLDVVHEEKNLPVLRSIMRNFYSPLKACDGYLRFVFITGITKFSQLSIFSELNNIKNISMDGEYAGVCGITEDEMLSQMELDLELFADRLKLTKEQAMEKLKENYDGYHFTWPSPDIYNPFSLLNAFLDGRLDSYWFGSGTPTYLIEMLRKYKVLPSQMGMRKAMAPDFDAPTERLTSIVPLMYQSGYLTIKDCNPLFGKYVLDIPNKEVRIGLMRSLVPYYVSNDTLATSGTIIDMTEALYADDMDTALNCLKVFLSTIPYCDHTDYEGHYQQMLYVIFSLLGMYCDVEVRTPRGRVDIVLRAPHTLYIIELKLDKSSDAAMNQIDLRQYPERFRLCGLPVVKVGINFDSEAHTLGEWRISALEH